MDTFIHHFPLIFFCEISKAGSYLHDSDGIGPSFFCDHPYRFDQAGSSSFEAK
jgi:hypothetical protein